MAVETDTTNPKETGGERRIMKADCIELRGCLGGRLLIV